MFFRTALTANINYERSKKVAMRTMFSLSWDIDELKKIDVGLKQQACKHEGKVLYGKQEIMKSYCAESSDYND